MSDAAYNDTHAVSSFLGDMYARWTLDCLTEIAYAIAADYFASPGFYQGLDAPDDIVDLWMSYGSAKNFPNKDQRYTLAGAIFGTSDGYSPKAVKVSTDGFHQTRDVLFKACIAAQTATAVESKEGLNQQVLESLPNFLSYLGGFAGKAASVAHNQIKAVSQTSFAVLRSDTVSSRFIGLHRPISADWPLQNSDANGDKLIAQCLQDKIGGIEMSRDFPGVRSLARAGKDALESIVQPIPDLAELIKKTYSWAMFTATVAQSTGSAERTLHRTQSGQAASQTTALR